MKMNIAPDGHWYVIIVAKLLATFVMKMNIAPDGHWYYPALNGATSAWLWKWILPLMGIDTTLWFSIHFINLTMKMNIAPDGHWYSAWTIFKK